MLALHAQGIYPSQNKVADLLSDPNLLFQPEAKAIWRALCRELHCSRKNKSACDIASATKLLVGTAELSALHYFGAPARCPEATSRSGRMEVE